MSNRSEFPTAWWGSNFEDNVSTAQEYLRLPSKESVALKGATLLTDKGERLYVPAEEGKFKSLLLFAALGQFLGKEEFSLVDGEGDPVLSVMSYFGELNDEIEKHPTMQFIKNGFADGVRVQLHPLGAEEVDWRTAIDTAWAQRNEINSETQGDIRTAVTLSLAGLDSGVFRVAEKLGGQWVTNQWLKKAVLLSFRLYDNMVVYAGDPPPYMAPLDPGNNFVPLGFDRVWLKTVGWDKKRFSDAGFRQVPGSVVRRGAFIGNGAILMPSFVNIGAYVGEGTMVDTWATVGSCAQIGKKCHISGGVGIGGVLEPLQANPTIIEDNCFVGARSEIVEGVVVGENSVIGMGVFLGQSTPIYNRMTGETSYGRIPPGSVVVSGSLPKKVAGGEYSLYAAIIVKQVDAQTRAKTSINELLRD